MWFGSPSDRKDVIKVGKVPKRFTRMSPGLTGLSCREMLDMLGLFIMERRRLKGDLIKVYKITRGIDNVNTHSLFPKVEYSNTRRHRLKVKGERFKRDLRDNYFTQSSLYLEFTARTC